MKILENHDKKVLASDNYNYIFDKHTGMFQRWGNRLEDDPECSVYGPEIADIEISTICSGVKGIGPCKFCYKSNTTKGKYMTFHTFDDLIHKLPRTVTQIAFGTGDIDSNPHMWLIFELTRSFGMIPNVTVNGEGITDEIADKLAKYCGAVAVSVYDKEKSYNAVKKLTDRGMKQVNIHFMLCEETYSDAQRLLDDKLTDKRLEKLNAIVFLSLKQKGRASLGFTRLPQNQFDALVARALEDHISIGFDSCGCHKFIASIHKHPKRKLLEAMSDPCESGLFSSYFNVDAKFFPCSFCEGTKGWECGIEVINSKEKFWENERLIEWREKLLKNKRHCPIYQI